MTVLSLAIIMSQSESSLTCTPGTSASWCILVYGSTRKSLNVLLSWKSRSIPVIQSIESSMKKLLNCLNYAASALNNDKLRGVEQTVKLKLSLKFSISVNCHDKIFPSISFTLCTERCQTPSTRLYAEEAPRAIATIIQTVRQTLAAIESSCVCSSLSRILCLFI